MSVKLALVLCAACVAVVAATNPPGLTTALEAQLEGFEAAFAKQDAAAASMFFTTDAVLMVDDAPAFVGRDQVQFALGDLMHFGTKALDLEIDTDLVITDSPATAYSVCTYIKHGANSVLDTGHSSMVWALTAGPSGNTWLVSAISDVSNVTQSSSLVTPPRPVFMPSNSAARQKVQEFFNTFQGQFNGNTWGALPAMLTSDVAVFTKHEPAIFGSADVSKFLQYGLYLKGYSSLSVVVVEAGPTSSGSYIYARGVMNFFTSNGIPVSGNNFLALFDNSDSFTQLKSFSVTPYNGY